MSEITFVDDDEARLWTDILRSYMMRGCGAEYSTERADLAVVERRKRIWGKGQPEATMRSLAEMLPVDVRRLLSDHTRVAECLSLGQPVLTSHLTALANDILAARKALGLDAPEVKP
jgi:hypothetical protein